MSARSHSRRGGRTRSSSRWTGAFPEGSLWETGKAEAGHPEGAEGLAARQSGARARRADKRRTVGEGEGNRQRKGVRGRRGGSEPVTGRPVRQQHRWGWVVGLAGGGTARFEAAADGWGGSQVRLCGRSVSRVGTGLDALPGHRHAVVGVEKGWVASRWIGAALLLWKARDGMRMEGLPLPEPAKPAIWEGSAERSRLRRARTGVGTLPCWWWMGSPKLSLAVYGRRRRRRGRAPQRPEVVPEGPPLRLEGGGSLFARGGRGCVQRSAS